MLMEADTKKVYIYIYHNEIIAYTMYMKSLFPQSELLAACQHGDSQTVWHLLQKGADPNCHDEVCSCGTLFLVVPTSI